MWNGVEQLARLGVDTIAVDQVGKGEGTEGTAYALLCGFGAVGLVLLVWCRVCKRVGQAGDCHISCGAK